MEPSSPNPISPLQAGLVAASSVLGLWMLLWWLGFAAPVHSTFDERFMLPVVEELAERWPEPSVWLPNCDCELRMSRAVTVRPSPAS